MSHVARIPLKPWWKRWASLVWGDTSAIHWYCQRDTGQVSVYREFVGTGVSAQELGVLLAESSNKAGIVKGLQVWMPREHFNPALSNKSVSAEIDAGIQLVLGPETCFVYVHTPDEWMTGDAGERLRSLARRQKSRASTMITLRAPTQENIDDGWEYLRGMLRTKPLYEAPKLEYDRVTALRLQSEDETGRKIQEYLKACSGQEPEVLPKLQIDPDCVELINCMRSLVRDDRNAGCPQLNERTQPALSLLYGMLAHSGEQPRQPLEEFIAGRMDAANRRKPLDGQSIYRVAEKAEADWKRKQPAVFSFAKRRQRPRVGAMA